MAVYHIEYEKKLIKILNLYHIECQKFDDLIDNFVYEFLIIIESFLSL